MGNSLIERLGKNRIDSLHTPDVLSCLANLSNDEVFTPPEVVNRMLDMLPQELFSDPSVTFLDPAVKTGVFLREITKRLLVGLEPIYPNLQERIDHILHEQVFGIAITELTSLLSRRSVYCSKYPNGKYSISHFDDAQGNIKFRRIRHAWNGNQCKFCGASKREYDRPGEFETHAYEFIHVSEEEAKQMKFDVIVSNPPYQLSDGGAQASAKPIYHLFVEQAKKLNPTYLTMIIPSRWFTGGKGLDAFRDSMINDKSIKKIVDYTNAADCFPGIKLEGGVCYFLWKKNNDGTCEVETHNDGVISSMERPLKEEGLTTFVRYNEAISIIRKVKTLDEETFDDLISSRKPFGLSTRDVGSSEKQYGDVTVYGINKSVSYLSPVKIKVNRNAINEYKVFISYAYGYGNSGFPHQIINKPFLGEKNTVCTETYLMIGPFNDKNYAENVISYMKTKFFRALVLFLKNTQHATKTVYQLVPMQDFNISWSDEMLYEKYKLDQDEIGFIESMVKSMED